jgi:hypothetical protein
MGSFKSIFPKKHTLLVVVHAVNFEQTWRNTLIAKEEGSDGIFLINHRISYQHLIDYYLKIKERLPDFWIGLNCLDLGQSAIGYIPSNTAGLWVDDPGIRESEENPTAIAKAFDDRRHAVGWAGLYFGGVAFKYQAPVSDSAKVAKLAIPFMDVITTSGDGTGIAANPRKIRIMKEAIGDHPLAIASGITPENISGYLPYSDCFLVATGVSNSHTELNPDRVRQLAQILKY